MPQSFARVYIHLIFSTRHRQKLIDESWAERLYEYIAGILKPRGNELLLGGGIEDHVHLLFSMGREGNLAETVRDVKSISCRWIHDVIPNRSNFAWQSGYSAFSVSYSGLNDVKRYIAGQREHHQTRTFQDELRTFLKKHGIEYDEKYLWD